MKLGYGDPPYFGCCGKFYDHYHGDGTYPFDDHCWDDIGTHKLLVEYMCDTYTDGWALSCTSTSLLTIGALCPSDVRIGVWVKSFSAFKRGVRPAYAWEPIIYRGGHNPPWEAHPPPLKGGKQTTPKDFVIAPITLRKGLTGVKPPKVNDAILDWLNVQPGDDFTDLFHGLGGMSERHALRMEELTNAA